MTTMTLEGSKVNYSERERELFAAIAKRNRLTTTDLLKLKPSNSFHKYQSMLSSLVLLSRKIAANDERFRLHRSKQRGPYPIEWWLEKKR
jgi:hypothetical protein